MRLRASARFQIFQGLRFRDGLKQVLMNPTRVFRDQPLYTLAITAPLALVWMAFFWLRWDLTPAAFIDEAYIVTTTLVIAPGLLMAVPLSLFYELERRRKHRITQRLPDMLDILASSNQMGVSFVNGLGMVARNLSGSLAEQLRYTYNDIHWNGDVHRALLNLAARMRVPQLTRTSYILAEGSRSSGELHRLMSIAAEDTRQRYRLDRNRRQNLQAYTTVVVIGFLVYLGVIVILDYSFLGAIQEALEGTDTDDLGPITIDLDDIGVYRALFYHSAIIMAVGTGFISGKLTDNEILSGLKYSIMLILLTALVFLFL